MEGTKVPFRSGLRLFFIAVLVSTFVSPAFAKSNEYNFNTCKYNFYNNVDPFSRQSTYQPVVQTGTVAGTTTRGQGQVGGSAEQMRTVIPGSMYEQTPQRTITLQNRRPQRQIVNTNYQPRYQQPIGYAYVPGQNSGKTVQTNVQGSVGYQINSSGAASYDSVSSSTTKNH